MTMLTPDSTAEFVAHWKRVGPLLTEIRRRELQQFDWDKDWSLVDALLELGAEQPAAPRTTSGLVDLQRFLQRAFG